MEIEENINENKEYNKEIKYINGNWISCVYVPFCCDILFVGDI